MDEQQYGLVHALVLDGQGGARQLAHAELAGLLELDGFGPRFAVQDHAVVVGAVVHDLGRDHRAQVLVAGRALELRSLGRERRQG